MAGNDSVGSMMNMARKMKNGAPKQGQENESTEVVDLPYLLKMEQETIEDYQKFLETEKDPQIAQVIQEILQEEQKHYEELQQLAGGGEQSGQGEQGQQEQSGGDQSSGTGY